jgi:3-dehydroquinate dehydratase-2
MNSTKILIINGPNLNMLGTREPEIYGSLTLLDIENSCRDRAKSTGAEIDFFQSNHEGEMVSEIQQAANNDCTGIIINAGAYTHTSVAIHDALKMTGLPIIEVHLSNIYKREEFRHKSYISPLAKGVICGLGVQGYLAAIDALT